MKVCNMSADRINAHTNKTFAQIQQSLERLLNAIRSENLDSIEIITEECTCMAMEFRDVPLSPEQNQKLKRLYQQAECILYDKLSSIEQKIKSIQESKKLFSIYRPE